MDETVPGSVDHTALIKNLRSCIAALVRASNQVPLLGEDFELFATYPEFMQFMNTQRSRVVILLRKLLAAAGLKSIKITESRLEDMSQLINANDQLVEQIARALDEYQASLNRDRIRARQISLGAEHIPNGPIVAPSSAAAAFQHRPFKDGGGRYAILSKTTQNNTTTCAMSTSAAIQTKPPQLYRFQQSIVNADQPFVPKLRIKHHAMERKPGKLKLVGDMSDERREWAHDEMEENGHPYELELEHFQVADNHLHVPNHVELPKPLDETPFVLVQRQNELEQLVDELNSTTEFAFDLEHHSMRSFLGLTCLLQISTRQKDYVVDPFPLWDSMYLLNEPFTNPNIVKIAFGSSCDIKWLQRDFGIYVVGLFDVGVAYRLVGRHKNMMPLSNLVSELCNVKLDKSHQRADWRTRPLTETLLNYARSDTHYLHAGFDHLKRELVKMPTGPKAIEQVYAESGNMSKLHFEQPRFLPNGYANMVQGGRRLNNRQEFALEKLWLWRDQTAREHDESLYYVLPDHMMLKIAEVLPREKSGILACCSPVPPLVRHELDCLNRIIAIARELPLESSTQPGASLPQQENADDFLSDPSLSNRVVGTAAKLEYRFDNSKRAKMAEEDDQQQQFPHFDLNKRLDEMQPQIKVALAETIGKVGDGRQEKMDRTMESKKKRQQKQQRRQWANKVPGNRRRIVIEDGREGGGQMVEEATMDPKERVLQIRSRLEQQSATPFDSYLIAMREKLNEGEDRKPDKAKLLTMREEKKASTSSSSKKYSHLDDDDEGGGKDGEEGEEVMAKSTTTTTERVEIKREVEDGEEEEKAAFFADPANLTKKARKRMLKKFRNAADIRFQ